MIAFRQCECLQSWGRRTFSSTAQFRSGHNRWSKIKHDKAKEDATVTRQRSAIAEELRLASRDKGPDPQFNTRLSDVISKAKKIGFPKVSIENAISRGQGLSPSGAPLENLTVEAMVPPSVAVIIECQTDSKARTLSEIRLAIKESGGTATPTNHLFERKGRVIFENPLNHKEADIFDRAIEAGAIDVEIDEGGNIVLTTEPSKTTAVASALVQLSDFKLVSSDVIWEPKEDMMVDASSSSDLLSFLDRIQEFPSVQEIYTNNHPLTLE